MSQRRTKVLSIVGPGRSGTTILGRMLGEVEGIVTAGELRWLWKRGVLEQRLCGCSRPQADCPVWSRVVTQVLGKGPGWTAGDIVRAQQQLAAPRNRVRVIRSATGSGTRWAALERVRAVTTDLCSALVQVTGARVVVDTSKRPHDAAVLAAVDTVDHYVCQIVRDPRAVAHSWRRVKPLPWPTGSTAMGTRRLTASVGMWMQVCASAELLRRYIPRERWLFTRYEDFARDPGAVTDQILGFLEESARGLVAADRAVVLGVHHTVEGNPDRFRTGSVSIVPDDEWRSRMPRRHQACVTAATMPLLLRYGYPILT